MLYSIKNSNPIIAIDKLANICASSIVSFFKITLIYVIFYMYSLNLFGLFLLADWQCLKPIIHLIQMQARVLLPVIGLISVIYQLTKTVQHTLLPITVYSERLRGKNTPIQSKLISVLGLLFHLWFLLTDIFIFIGKVIKSAFILSLTWIIFSSLYLIVYSDFSSYSELSLTLWRNFWLSTPLIHKDYFLLLAFFYQKFKLIGQNLNHTNPFLR